MQRLRGLMSRSAATSLVRSSQLQSRTALARWHPPPASWDSQFGDDYPKLPWVPFDQRDPKANWDDPVHRRMFGETIPEEFDMQDAYFQGEHDPVNNLWEGFKGQAWIAAIAVGFLGLAYASYNPDTKPGTRATPDSVRHHLQNHNLDRVNKRPYEAASNKPAYDGVVHDLNN